MDDAGRTGVRGETEDMGPHYSWSVLLNRAANLRAVEFLTHRMSSGRAGAVPSADVGPGGTNATVRVW